MEAADEIAAVLRRVADLRTKINYSDAACARPAAGEGGEKEEWEGGEEEDAASLLSIRDAMVSLEVQLASLQDLQQQQQYECEAVLSKINAARKFLLQKLRDYEGADLEVIHVASAFAGGRTEGEEVLLLPPYLNQHPDSLLLDDPYSSRVWGSSHEVEVNGKLHRTNKTEIEPKKPCKQKTSSFGLKCVFSFSIKAVGTLISVMTVLNLSGLEVNIRNKSSHFNMLELSFRR